MGKIDSVVGLPTKLLFLVSQKSRYKVVWGGRGSAKSWTFARALIFKATKEKTRVLCAREHQTSIAESVHRLLKDQIESMGVSELFKVQAQTIYGPHGSEFIFAGIATDPDKVKSTEGVDICWVEEAENVSDRSWETLIPTIRAAGSEIWVSFNPPQTRKAPTWQRFVVNPPQDAIVVKVSYRDNPWFPEVLEKERQELERNDPVRYRHVWLGEIAIPGNTYFPVQTLLDAEENLRPALAVGELRESGDKMDFIARKDGWLEVFEMPSESEHYVMAADVAEGKEGADQHSAQVLKRGLQSLQVARFSPLVGADDLGRYSVRVAKWYNGRVPLAFERTGGWGAPAIIAARDSGYQHLFRMPMGKPGTDREEQEGDIGWETTTASRPQLLNGLYSGLRDGSLIVRSETTLDQLRTFITYPSGPPRAARGCHDDEVIGLGIALQMIDKTKPIEKPKPYTPRRTHYMQGQAGAWMGQ